MFYSCKSSNFICRRTLLITLFSLIDKEEEQSYSLSSQSWLTRSTSDLHLIQEDKLILETRQWLTDKHIIAAQELLLSNSPMFKDCSCHFWNSETNLNEHAQYKRGLGRPENGVRKNNSKLFGHALFVAFHSRPNTKARSYLGGGGAYTQFIY